MAKSRIPLDPNQEAARILQERLELSPAEIGLTVRTTNILEEDGIFTVRELLSRTQAELFALANFGERTLEEVYAALERFGFSRNIPRQTSA